MLFADADDFFADNAIDIFNEYIDSEKYLLHTNYNTIYSDTLEKANRNKQHSYIIQKSST
ncbi:MAG: hypothetical protein EOL88_03140 [Bacteroidia bacterium]|nr:hypothetical protein [Bacteroidia bacterium]